MMCFDETKTMQKELLQMLFRNLVIAITVAKEQLTCTKCMHE
jgi:hypothetical protein